MKKYIKNIIIKLTLWLLNYQCYRVYAIWRNTNYGFELNVIKYYPDQEWNGKNLWFVFLTPGIYILNGRNRKKMVCSSGYRWQGEKG